MKIIIMDNHSDLRKLLINKLNHRQLQIANQLSLSEKRIPVLKKMYPDIVILRFQNFSKEEFQLLKLIRQCRIAKNIIVFSRDSDVFYQQCMAEGADFFITDAWELIQILNSLPALSQFSEPGTSRYHDSPASKTKMMIH